MGRKSQDKQKTTILPRVLSVIAWWFLYIAVP